MDPGGQVPQELALNLFFLSQFHLTVLDFCSCSFQVSIGLSASPLGGSYCSVQCGKHAKFAKVCLGLECRDRSGTLPAAGTTGESRHVLFLKFMKTVTR